jgi:5'-nucleotidase (lipoprotein e(P4) family)
MIKISNIYFILLAVLFFWSSACNRTPSEEKIQLSNDIKWARQSLEYRAVCIQTYKSAWKYVKKITGKLHEDWAVVLDVDETLLDNSFYEEYIFKKGEKYPYFWDDWVKRAEAEPIVGAKNFIDSVRTLSPFAHIVFITNRDTSQESATIENLMRHKMWSQNDRILCRRDKTDKKENRRNEVSEGTGRCNGDGRRLIIALIGDQINDVTEFDKEIPLKQLKGEVLDNKNWGQGWYILPNPMYGYWVNEYK